MFPPMVSASPPPSDDELSGDEGEELGVADSSYDITGLSQKLPVCQTQRQKPAARPEQTPAAERVTPPPARLPSDEWGDFSDGAVVSSSAGPPLPSAPSRAPPLQSSAGEPGVPGADRRLPATMDVPQSDVDPAVAVMASSAQASSVFSDSDSDSDAGQADRIQPQTAEQGSDAGALTTGRESVKLAGAVSVERDVSAGVGETGPRENGTLTNHQTEAEGFSTAVSGADSDGDDFGDFGGFSAETGADQFGGWSEPVINSVDTEVTQTVTGDNPQPDHGNDSLQPGHGNDSPQPNHGNDSPQPNHGNDSPQPDHGNDSQQADHRNDSPQPNHGNDSPEAEDDPHLGSRIKPNATQPEPLASRIASLSSHAVPPDDFGDFEAPDEPEDRGDSGGGSGVNEGTVDRVPSPGDAGAFAKSGEPPSSAEPVDDVIDITPGASDEVKAVPASEPVNTSSSMDNSPKRAKSPDHFGSFAKSSDELADPATPPNDSGDFAGSTDDFGDFSAPTDDFGDFAAPTDDFGDFPAPGESSGAAWPPAGAGGGGGESAGFADFGAVFAAPADSGSAGAPLGPPGQLADPADFSDDDFGDFEDFQAPAPQEPAAVTDEAAVSALLARLFPLSQEEREPASVPLDASGVWYQLREPDTTAALQYRWSGSHAYSALLHALRVDVRNIINFGGWGGRPGRFSSPPLDSEPILPRKGPLLPEPALPEQPAPPQQPPQQPQQQPAAGEVPPAAFDWNSAGLKNPLESAGPESYSLLDLDVFDTDARPVAASNSFLSCLERELLAAEEPPPPPSSSQAGSGTVYSRLLAQTAAPPLSDAVSSVLARIPDIDFMQAKVLMFPVRGE